jgi:hypothetical protein
MANNYDILSSDLMHGLLVVHRIREQFDNEGWPQLNSVLRYCCCTMRSAAC